MQRTACTVMSLALVVIFGTIESGRAGEKDTIPDLVGTWVGENRTVSDKKGYKVWGRKTVEITEQQDRRFRGHFTYPEGTTSRRWRSSEFRRPDPIKGNSGLTVALR